MSEEPEKDDLDINEITTLEFDRSTKTFIDKSVRDNPNDEDKDLLKPPYILELGDAKAESTYFVKSIDKENIVKRKYKTDKIHITDKDRTSNKFLSWPYYLEPTFINRTATMVERFGSKLSNQFRRKNEEEGGGGQKVPEIPQKTPPYQEEKIEKKFPKISFMYFST